MSHRASGATASAAPSHLPNRVRAPRIQADGSRSYAAPAVVTAVARLAAAAAGPEAGFDAFAKPGRRTTGAPSVLIVSPDPDRLREWTMTLQPHGLEPRQVATVAGALDHLTSREVDVVLADAELPAEGALDLAKRLCGGGPSVLILGRDDIVDRVVAIELGADDLLPRSIDGRELVARLRTITRRKRGVEPSPGAAVWRARPGLRTLEAPNGRVASLSSVHWQVLMLMAGSDGRPIDGTIAAAAIPSFRENPDAALRTAMSRLRRRLTDQIGVAPISSFYGTGYVLTVPLIVSANDR